MDSKSALPAGVRPDPAVLAARPGIVHIGLGAFARAHLFEFTADAVAAVPGDWGVRAVAPRSIRTVEALHRQDLLSSVLVRAATEDGDRIRVNGLLRDAWCAATRPDVVVAALADPATRIVTLTITEAGYRVDPATGLPRTDDDELAADLSALSRPDPLRGTRWHTTPGLLVAGLLARFRAGGAPLAVVSCDNLAGNGAILATAMRGAADRVAADPGFAAWLESAVDCPDTVVDRITPATTDADRARAEALLGVRDDTVVTCEPYRQWVIADRFPAGRPAWERAGARLVDDVGPYAAAKLRLLNAGHTMLAYLGLLLGVETVAGAMDHTTVAQVTARYLRAEALPALASPLELSGYLDVTLTRFAQPRMAHRLDQIAVDGSQKLVQRIVPTLRVAGAGSLGLLAVAGWGVLARRRVEAGTQLRDPRASAVAAAVLGRDPAGDLLALLAPDLSADDGMRSAVAHHLSGLTADPAGHLRAA